MLLTDNHTISMTSQKEMEDNKQLQPKFLALKNRLNGMVPEGKTATYNSWVCFLSFVGKY